MVIRYSKLPPYFLAVRSSDNIENFGFHLISRAFKTHEAWKKLKERKEYTIVRASTSSETRTKLNKRMTLLMLFVISRMKGTDKNEKADNYFFLFIAMIKCTFINPMS